MHRTSIFAKNSMRFLSFAVACGICVSAYAVPAYPNKVLVRGDSGEEIPITICGDENFKYAVSEDNYTLLNTANGWKYACLSEDGRLIASPYALTASSDKINDVAHFKASTQKNLLPAKQQRKNAPQRATASRTLAPVVGEKRALVILMQYADVKFSKSVEDFEELFNGSGPCAEGSFGSVKDFYSFASDEQLNYVSDIYGPYTSKEPMKFYGANASDGGKDINAIQLALEAIRSLPRDIDFSVYDNDNDGSVDNVHIIFAGYGEEAGASASAIWSHEYPGRLVLKHELGYNFNGYSCTPELNGNRGKTMSHIGVICHELGHALGAMDYYDTDYEGGGSYDGTGLWDIMASGSWNDEGRTPCNFNPYVRAKIFGWTDIKALPTASQVTIPAGSSEVYLLPTADADDYFLLENRAKDWFNSALPGYGLMIYHIHPSIESRRPTNTINASHPQGCYPVCAGGNNIAVKNYGNINSAHCPFPGLSNNRSFNSGSSPAALAWSGAKALFSLENILSNSNGDVSFNTGGTTVTEPDIPEDFETIFAESFENSSTLTYTVTNSKGRQQWMYYPGNALVQFSQLIPKASDGKRLLILFNGRQTMHTVSYAAWENVTVAKGKESKLCFDYQAVSTGNTPLPKCTITLTCGSTNKYKELTDTCSKWQRIEIPFVANSEKVSFEFAGSIYSGGIFIDNICLQQQKDASIILPEAENSVTIEAIDQMITVMPTKDCVVAIFNINGMAIVNRFTESGQSMTTSTLPKGLYIVQATGCKPTKVFIK